MNIAKKTENKSSSQTKQKITEILNDLPKVSLNFVDSFDKTKNIQLPKYLKTKKSAPSKNKKKPEALFEDFNETKPKKAQEYVMHKTFYDILTELQERAKNKKVDNS